MGMGGMPGGMAGGMPNMTNMPNMPNMSNMPNMPSMPNMPNMPGMPNMGMGADPGMVPGMAQMQTMYMQNPQGGLTPFQVPSQVQASSCGMVNIHSHLFRLDFCLKGDVRDRHSSLEAVKRFFTRT